MTRQCSCGESRPSEFTRSHPTLCRACYCEYRARLRARKIEATAAGDDRHRTTALELMGAW